MTDAPSDRTELLVIGGGPGGYAAAFRAADLGVQVTLVSDEPQLGGVCLLRGCIPSKALLEVAELVITTRETAERGIEFDPPTIDLDRLRSWKDGVVSELTGGLEQLAEQRGVRVIRARARFESSQSVQLSDGDTQQDRLSFEHAVIATGSRPIAPPGTHFGDRIVDSARALEMHDIPERLLVVGGGYVGLEMGTVYATLGSEVTLVEATDRLLPPTDPDLVEPLARHVGDLLAGVHLRTEVTEMQEKEDVVSVSFEGDETPRSQDYQRVLVAVGRRPNSDDLGLEATRVELDEDGFVVVDRQRRTKDRSIRAIGDVAGGMMLAHEAMHEGFVAAEAIAGGPAAFDVRAIPAVVYTDPQIAWCGLTERAAEQQGRRVEVSRFPWRASGRALTLGSGDGMTKILSDPESGRILGVGIVGRNAESLIGQGVTAIEMGAVAEDLDRMIAAHPTLTETLHEAAQVALERPLHLAPGRRRGQ